MFRITELMGFPVNLAGDEPILFIILNKDLDCLVRKDIERFLANLDGYKGINWIHDEDRTGIIVRFVKCPDPEVYTSFLVYYSYFVDPIGQLMPIAPTNDSALPFRGPEMVMGRQEWLAEPASELAIKY